MSYLELRNLDKIYPGAKRKTLDNMNLSIEKGEFIVFLGPSGCGKTTTIRMISGLEEVSGGEILIEGKPIMNLPPRDRGVSMIFQSYAIWPHMTVYDNIAYPLKLRKLPKSEIEKRVQAAAEITNINEFLKRYPSQLSGGQRQRVAVSRAIVVEPKIFLMDEPLSNLDAKLRVSMRTDLKNIHLSLRSTTIFVTHDQSEAMSLADRIVIMKDGLIEQIGSPDDVYHDCESVFVASFIGTPPTNFFDADVENDAIAGAGFRYLLSDEEKSLLSAYRSQRIRAGVRPEYFYIHKESAGDKNLFAEAKVDFIEPQGSHSIVVVRIGQVWVKIMTYEQHNFAPGEKIFIYCRENTAMFFDEKTQKRIRGGQA